MIKNEVMTLLNRYTGLFLILIFFTNVCLGSRTVISEPLTEKDTSKTAKQSLFAGAGFGSNMLWLGSTISNDLPYYTGSLTYGYNGVLFISGTASVVSRFNTIPSFYSLSATFNHTFNSWFDISASSSGYKTRDALQDTLFSDFGYFNFTSGFDWKIIYTRLSLSGLISQDNKSYIQITNSRYFRTVSFLGDHAYISFNPEISILAGEITEITNSAGIKKYGASPPFRHLKRPTAQPTSTYKTIFGLIDYEFAFPVDFIYKNLNLELEPGYIFPAYKNAGYPAPKGFWLYLSAILKIF